jgi:hypothetical protein
MPEKLALLTSITRKCCIMDEWQECESCNAAFDKETEVWCGPKVQTRFAEWRSVPGYLVLGAVFEQVLKPS